MSKKFSITISDDAYKALTRLAKRRGDSSAGLAAFFVEANVEDARKRGELPTDSDFAEVIDLWNNFLDAIEQGGFYTDKQITILSVQVDRTVESLHKIQNCYRGMVSKNDK